MDIKTNLYTIKEINKKSKEEGFSSFFQSYTSIYSLIKSGRLPVVKAGNRYLLRICDIEKALMATTVMVDGIRRID
ncbi:hypothetical protein [Pelosinus sp. sgz500959]|uniref:hypothetical protein n=1 Tax=Pelosinus sp. sgz500959 TaxID=3242472 RepID=UPI00366D43F8